MKFSTRENIKAPVDVVFGAVSDFSGLEQLIQKKGGKLTRTDNFTSPQQGMVWNGHFRFRKKRRPIDVKLAEYEDPQKIRFEALMGGINVDFTIEISEKSANDTLMLVSADLKPKTLSARILVQSMRVAKSRLTKTFKQRVMEYGQAIEADYEKRKAL